MMSQPLPLLIVILLAAICVTLGVLLVRRADASRGPADSGTAGAAAALLFEDGRLVHATEAARGIVGSVSGGPNADEVEDLPTITERLRPRFPELGAAVSTAESRGLARAEALDRGGWIDVEIWGGRLRLTLHEDGGAETGRANPAAIAAMEEELATLRALAEASPELIWKEDGSGALTWANASYLDLVRQASGQTDDAAGWPPPALFPAAPAPAEAQTDSVVRQPLALPGRKSPLWYEIVTRGRGPERMRFGTDVTAAVAAETTGKSFTQTLAKTFALLSTGLAVFDADRRLMIFNPALVDLTGLPVGFLSSRPGIRSFLDMLRDRQMLPEPRNYVSWREHMSALEAEAAEGAYCETWSLHDERTYRVTGRPHLDGSLVLLIEDISAEIGQARRSRSEVATARAVIDRLDEAVAVFSSTGHLIMSNAAYERDWSDDDGGLHEIALSSELQRWHRTAPHPDLWRRIGGWRDRDQGRDRILETVTDLEGRELRVRAESLPGGGLVVGLHREGESTARHAPPDAGDDAAPDRTGTRASSDPGAARDDESEAPQQQAAWRVQRNR